jgi:hypothetical protein
MGKQAYWRVVLAVLILPSLPLAAAQAVNITVDGTVCTLADAITAANTDAAAGGCPAGSGADTITLQSDVILAVALPQIASAVTIDGGNHTISGNNNSRVGTVLTVADTGNLTLNETTITGGCNTASVSGGGIWSYSGTVTLNNSTVSENFVSSSSYSYSDGGGGIWNYEGSVTLNNSTVSENSISSSSYFYSDGNGGGIWSYSGTITLNNSTVSKNFVSSSSYSYSDGGGGGIWNYEGSVTLNNSTVRENSISSSSCFYSDGGGIWNYEGTVVLCSSIVSGNKAYRGNEIYNYSSTVIADSYNLFGHNGVTGAQAFVGLTPGSSDVTATSDGTKPTAQAAILSSLADNSGPTLTHALPEGSPAIDLDTA